MRRIGILTVSLTLAHGAAFGADVAIEGATVITIGPQGVIEDGIVVISDGKIAAVGSDVTVPTARGASTRAGVS